VAKLPHYSRTTLFSVFFLALFLFFTPEAFGASDGVSNRLTSLENRWGHLHLGGQFTLTADYDHGSYEGSALQSTSDIRQELQVFLNARLDRNFDLSLSLIQQNSYGRQNLSGFIPFLDEAVLRYRSSNFLADLGRFQFSLDPLGLIADHSSFPVEGVAVQTGTQDYYLGGYYSRFKTTYPFPDDIVVSGNETALRLAFPQPGYLVGITLVPCADTAVAVDLMTDIAGGTLQGEAAWYRPGLEDYPEYRHNGAFGGLLAWKKNLPDSAAFMIKAGAFQEGFFPLFSSLAHASNNGEFFAPNTCGLAGEYSTVIGNNWELLVKGGLLSALNDWPENPQFSFSGRVKKSFSPSVSLEAGYDSHPLDSGRYGLIICRLTALF